MVSSKKSRIRVATRGSQLALTQTRQVIEELKSHVEEGIVFEEVIIRTTGDRMQTQLVKGGDATKNIFTKEIEDALLADEADLAVHSCKDLGVRMPKGLTLAGTLSRKSPRDVLIKRSDEPLPEDGIVLTGSIRRKLQWLERYPKAEVHPIRGNIDTRIRTFVDDPSAHGLILAEAGLQRLTPDTRNLVLEPLSPQIMVPAPGQGALALQCRESDSFAKKLLQQQTDAATFAEIQAERAFLIAMNAGCQEPLGALAETREDGTLSMQAVYYQNHDVAQPIRHQVVGRADEPKDLGNALAKLFLGK